MTNVAIALVGDQLGGTLQSVVHCGGSQKTARGELKGCMWPNAFDICNTIITYVYGYIYIYIYTPEGCEHILT